MSTNAFSFPPPPPPPRQSSDARTQPGRGRGHVGGSLGGRGAPRGSNFQRGNSSWGRGRGNYGSHHTVSDHNLNTIPSFRAPGLSSPSKRTHASAFSHNSQSRPHAPPSVPSFNASIENLLPPKPATKHLESRSPLPKKPNLLGLTPTNNNGSDSEDDIDEETRLVDAASSSDLQFEYKGQTSTLRTPSEIAAWIAERRRRWPTQAKRDAGKKEADEKKRRWEEEKKKRAEAIQTAKAKRAGDRRSAATQKVTEMLQKPSLSTQGATLDSVQEAQSRAERLRRKAAKAQRRLEVAELELLKSGNGSNAVSVAEEKAPDLNRDEDSSSSLSDSSEPTDSTSSSESEEDSGPEALSSKVEVESIAPSSQNAARVRKPCQFFVKNGTCKYGGKCKYAHDSKEAYRDKTMATGSNVGRKGLWQVMVEKEQEVERKKVLQAIIALAKQGVLTDS